ncbi:hypothetical protein BBP40_000689 [Aspergillus hancockii]|nr:hypothetical protein BBP40_000689 [Aspergillus hancockii]
MANPQLGSSPPETIVLPTQTRLATETAVLDGRPSTEKGSTLTLAGSHDESPPTFPPEKTQGNDAFDEKPHVNEEPLQSQKAAEEGYPGSWKLGLITIGLCLSIFCLSLDNTILSTAIPRITDEFKSLEDVGWYGSSYLLTACAMALTFGKLYTFYSTKWVYLIALFIFELGSLICAVTPNSLGLILGRAIAGFGSAGLFSGALIIIAQTVPLNRRPIFSAMLGSIYGISSVAGPLMGGGVTGIFLLFFFKAPKSVKAKAGFKGQLGQLDIPGTLIFMPCIICALLALQWGGTMYAWNSPQIIALFVVFGLLLVAFIGVQWRQQDNAMVPPRLIKNRNVWGAGMYNFCIGAAFFILIFYLPIWFQAIKNVSATKSGIMNLPLLLPMIICSIAAGACVTIFGYYTPFMIAAPVLLAIGGGLLSTLKVDSGHAQWIGYQVIYGIGIGIGFQQAMIVVQTALPIADVPVVTALVMFAQTLGGALFVSVGQNVFQNQLRKNILAKAPDVDVAKVAHVGATMLRHAVPKDILPAVLEAYNEAITQTFYVSLAIGTIAIFFALPIQWLSVKGKKIEMAAA